MTKVKAAINIENVCGAIFWCFKVVRSLKKADHNLSKRPLLLYKTTKNTDAIYSVLMFFETNHLQKKNILVEKVGLEEALCFLRIRQRL